VARPGGPGQQWAGQDSNLRVGYLGYNQGQSPLCHRPVEGGIRWEDDGTRTRNGLAHDQAPQPFGSSSVRNQGLEPRTNCVWSSRSAAELIAHVLLPTVVGADE
jgi:hypothetical protein